jgi:hypothetical protein
MPELDKPVPAILEVRRNRDGAIRRDPKPHDYYGDFIWSEGNFGCDCNRYLFWCRAIGESEDDENERRCGNERYSIRLTSLDGRVLYDELSVSVAAE